MRTVFIECDRFLSGDEHRVMLENMKYEAGDDVRIVLLAPGMRVAEPAPQWIPCSERLPKQGQEVICQCRASIIKVLKLDADGDWYQDAGHCYMSGFVIAWMPLPEPYKEEEH